MMICVAMLTLMPDDATFLLPWRWRWRRRTAIIVTAGSVRLD